jgi:hypothetical protein
VYDQVPKTYLTRGNLNSTFEIYKMMRCAIFALVSAVQTVVCA